MGSWLYNSGSESEYHFVSLCLYLMQSSRLQVLYKAQAELHALIAEAEAETKESHVVQVQLQGGNNTNNP